MNFAWWSAVFSKLVLIKIDARKLNMKSRELHGNHLFIQKWCINSNFNLAHFLKNPGSIISRNLPSFVRIFFEILIIPGTKIFYWIKTTQSFQAFLEVLSRIYPTLWRWILTRFYKVLFKVYIKPPYVYSIRNASYIARGHWYDNIWTT